SGSRQALLASCLPEDYSRKPASLRASPELSTLPANRLFTLAIVRSAADDFLRAPSVCRLVAAISVEQRRPLIEALVDYHRRPQPVPPRTSLMISSSTMAPIAALTIALTMPTPR